MEFKQPKLFGKDEDGMYLGKVDMIGIGSECDTVYISNRKPNLWIFSLLNGYKQIGVFKIDNPHTFSEGDLIQVKKENNEIISITKEETE